ncbi:MAG: tetratricopeptide repeat protein [Pseudanabaena sp. CRU_2_10]|nr:tetratricopeptide repeat protein [Pseudanabaena sp. CRU_2_10]
MEIDPNYADAYYNRGKARTDLSDREGAIADYTRAIELNPNLADAYGNRGILLYNMRDKQGAIADLQKAADLFQKQGNQDSYQKTLNLLRQLQAKNNRTLSISQS